MMEDEHFTVEYPGREAWSLDGGDTVICSYPQSRNGPATPEQLEAWAVRFGEASAVALGTHLHHGDFVITSDPDTVKTFGIMPIHDGCEDCEQGVKLTLAHMEANPEARMVIGQLHWGLRP